MYVGFTWRSAWLRELPAFIFVADVALFRLPSRSTAFTSSMFHTDTVEPGGTTSQQIEGCT